MRYYLSLITIVLFAIFLVLGLGVYVLNNKQVVIINLGQEEVENGRPDPPPRRAISF